MGAQATEGSPLHGRLHCQPGRWPGCARHVAERLCWPCISAEEDCKAPADRRALLAALAGCPEGAAAAAEVQVSEPSAAKVAALVQATTARLRYAEQHSSSPCMEPGAQQEELAAVALTYAPPGACGAAVWLTWRMSWTACGWRSPPCATWRAALASAAATLANLCRLPVHCA